MLFSKCASVRHWRRCPRLLSPFRQTKSDVIWAPAFAVRASRKRRLQQASSVLACSSRPCWPNRTGSQKHRLRGGQGQWKPASRQQRWKCCDTAESCEGRPGRDLQHGWQHIAGGRQKTNFASDPRIASRNLVGSTTSFLFHDGAPGCCPTGRCAWDDDQALPTPHTRDCIRQGVGGAAMGLRAAASGTDSGVGRRRAR